MTVHGSVLFGLVRLWQPRDGDAAVASHSAGNAITFNIGVEFTLGL